MAKQIRNTKDLKSMSLTQLRRLADVYATKLQWLHSTGVHTEDPERYMQTAGELYHIADIIEEKEKLKTQKRKDFNK